MTGEFHLQERLLEAGYKRKILESSGGSFWPSFILGDTLRMVFQNLLLESNDEILHCSDRVWRLLVQVFNLITVHASKRCCHILLSLLIIICLSKFF